MASDLDIYILLHQIDDRARRNAGQTDPAPYFSAMDQRQRRPNNGKKEPTN